MRKFLENFFIMFLIVVVILLLYSIIVVVDSWKYEPEDQIINIPILSGIEIVVLDSEKELPSESSLVGDEKDKLYVAPGTNVLKMWLFSSKISKSFFYQEMKVDPYENLQYKRSWLILVSPFRFLIKSLSLKENNLLKIELGVYRSDDKVAIFIFGFWAVFMIFLLILLILYVHPLLRK